MTKQPTIGFALVIAISSLILTVCSPADTGGTTTSTTDRTTTTSRPQSTTTSEPGCLANPVDAGTGEQVGSVTSRISAYGEVDCEEVFGGEIIRERAVMATDDRGIVDFSLNLGDSNCSLREESQIQVIPSSEIALDVAGGTVYCDFSSAPGDVVVKAGEVLTTVQVTEETLVTYSLQSDSTTTISVLRGFVTLAPTSMVCSSVLGPHQQADVPVGGTPTVRQLEESELEDIWDGVLQFSDKSLFFPQPSAELLPGLTELVDEQEVTVLVDGQLIDSGLPDAVPTLESVTGSRLEVIDPGEVHVLDPLPVFEPPTMTFEEPMLPIESFDHPALIDPERLSAALDQLEPVEPAVTEFLVDPLGRRWGLAYDSTDAALRERLETTLTAQLQSGEFGAFYYEIFGSTPDYGQLIPRLIADSEPCELVFP